VTELVLKNQLVVLLALGLLLSSSVWANVIGSDDRVPMLSDTMPWSAIGRLSIGESGVCTATLVASDIILTAAHCLIDERSGRLHHLDKAVVFSPNYKNGAAYHHARVISVWMGTRTPRKELWNDYAFARISEPLGNMYGTIPVRSFDGDHLEKEGPKLVSLAGYSLDFEEAKTAGVHLNCNIKQVVKDDDIRKLLAHDCDMRPGASGGPILSFTNESAVIVGVNVAERNYMISVSRILGRSIPYNLRTSANLAVTTDRMMGLYNILTRPMGGGGF
jgi:V8-like Glu-specific endopeptidase